jgi:hypothetical protein
MTTKIILLDITRRIYAIPNTATVLRLIIKKTPGIESPLPTQHLHFYQNLLLTLSLLPSRQSHKNSQQLQIVRRAQPRHRIPSRHRRVSVRPASRIIATLDIIEGICMRIDRRVNEADGSFAGEGTMLVDERDDGTKGWGRGGGAVD